MKKIVRKDYNKPKYCPAMTSPGINFRYPWERNLPVCIDGISGYYADDCNDWHFHTCEECGTKTLPLITKYIDPAYYASIIWWYFK